MKAGWEFTPVGKVCTVIAGQSPEGQYYNAQGNGLPFFQGKKDFQEKHIGEARVWTRKVTKEAQSGDILMSVRAPVGPINFATQHCCIGRGLAAIRAGKELDADYLYYILLFKESEISGNEGAVFASINKSEIEAIEIPLPSLDEQRRIVAVLDKAFAGIATATANAQKNLTNARALFESYLQATFAARGAGWTEQRFVQICENLDSIRRPVTKSLRTTGHIPYYGASGQVDSVADYLFDEDLLLVSEDGANLLMRTYPIAFSISGKSWVNNHAHVLRFSDRNAQAIVEYYLNSISLEPYVSGMAQPKLNQKSLNGIPIPLPPDDQRAGMVKILDGLSNQVEALEAIYENRLAALTELKQSLLHKAFAGELT